MSNFPGKVLARVAWATWYSSELERGQQSALPPVPPQCPPAAWEAPPHPPCRPLGKATPPLPGPGSEEWGDVLGPSCGCPSFVCPAGFPSPFPDSCGGLPHIPGASFAPRWAGAAGLGMWESRRRHLPSPGVRLLRGHGPRGMGWARAQVEPLDPAGSEAGPGSDIRPLRGGLCGWPPRGRGLQGRGGAASCPAHLGVRSCICSSRPSEVEDRDSPSCVCSRTVDRDCFLRSFLWVAVSLRACTAEAGCAAAPGPCSARWAGAMLPSEAALGPSPGTPEHEFAGDRDPNRAARAMRTSVQGDPGPSAESLWG